MTAILDREYAELLAAIQPKAIETEAENENLIYSRASAGQKWAA